MNDFVVMDFETANAQRHSAASIALVVVRNGEIVDKFYSLIQTPTPFAAVNTAIHGLTARDVADAPTFAELWPFLAPFFGPDQLVVAHNAPFDAGILRETLTYYDVPVPTYQLLDTVRSSRKLYPEFANHKLNTVAAELAIPLAQHHNALADASATANILLAQIQTFGANALAEFIKLQRA